MSEHLPALRQPEGVQPARLTELEAVIERGLTTFVEVGQALLEIRDSRLYRETHATFEAYVKERWGWGRTNADNYIQAARVAVNVQPVGQLPTLSHGMLLSDFSPDEQRSLAPVVSAMSVAEAREFLGTHRSNGAHVMHNGGESEWYTPKEIIEAVREVLGGIDLDPASHPDAQAVIQATRFFTAEDDGLSQEWAGRVWLNPPYSQPLIGEFCEKLIKHVLAGQVPEAITLTNNATETAWATELLHLASAVCFPVGRVRFWNPQKESAPLQGQMLCYFGQRPERFAAAFAPFGPIERPWHEPLSKFPTTGHPVRM